VFGASELDVKAIEKGMELPGDWNAKDGVLRFSRPRTDLQVVVAGVPLPTSAGLTSWAAFTSLDNHKSASHQAAVMGDLVLTEGQVNFVMSAALDMDLEVTALHNHFFADSPKVMFMHISGMGDEQKLAAAVGFVFKALEASQPISFPQTDLQAVKGSLDAKKLDQIFGLPGAFKDGVYKWTVGRAVKMHGKPMEKAMGVSTWAALLGSDQLAVADGDFAVLESELQSVLKSLRRNKINVVAIHNHMTQESPRLIFLHYWGVGPAADLAKSLSDTWKTQTAK